MFPTPPPESHQELHHALLRLVRPPLKTINIKLSSILNNRRQRY
jgi:hypothetical protein